MNTLNAGMTGPKAPEEFDAQEAMTIASIGLFAYLKQVAVKHPDGVAIVDGSSRLTYRELIDHVETFSDALHAKGVKAQDKVAVVLGNSAAFIIAVMAAWRAGVVVIPLNPQMQEAEFLQYFLDSGPTTLITTTRHRGIAGLLSANGASVAHVWLHVPTEGEWIWESPTGLANRDAMNTSPRVESDPDLPALTQYSTGSTGSPKRVTRTQRQLLGEFFSVLTVLKLTPADRVLGVIPFFHSHGLKNAAMLPLFAGATVYAQDIFFPRDVAQLIEREKITLYPGIPFMFQQLATLHKHGDFSSLRWVFSGAAPLPRATVEAFENAYSVKLKQVYGTTETGLICVQREATEYDGFNRVGVPIPGVRVEIVDEHGAPVAEGDEGRVKVVSPFAASKYDNSPGNSECYFAAGSYFPGDMGRMSADGQLILSGRHRGFINVGGNKVDPAEVEAALLTHPDIEEAAVLGVPDPNSGERVKAVIVSSTSLSNTDIRNHLLPRLAEFKHPRLIEFRKDLPKTPLGKVQRKSLLNDSPGG